MNDKLSVRERVAITRRGFGVLKRYCPGLARGKALLALITSLQPFVGIWFSARIIDELSVARRPDALVLYAVAAVLTGFAVSIARSLLDKTCTEKESQMWSWFGKVFSDKQVSMDYADIENAGIQRQKKQAEENLFMFGNGLGQLVWGTVGLVEAAVNISVSLAMSVTLFTQSSGNAALDNPLWIAALAICVVLGGLSNSKAVVKENEEFERWTKGSVWFNRAFEFFGHELYMNPERAKDLRIYEQNRAADRHLNGLLQADKANGKSILRMSSCQAVSSVIIGVGNALCYLFIAAKAFFGAFGAGSIVQYAGALNRLSAGVQGLMYTLPDNAVYCTHLKSLFEFLDIPNSKQSGDMSVDKGVLLKASECAIEFRDVSFKYPASDSYALEHVSFKLHSGEKLAVVGMNGSGKTTLVKLLCRLYDPTEGAILLGGVDIRQYDYDEYMALFSVVFQDFRLFSFGLGQNVAASADYDADRATACLKEAGFGDRLATLSDGLETNLYKDFDVNSVEISGGEAQKVAIARALYRDAPVMVLDEPTAALDPIAEYEIYSRFDAIANGKTAIYISHRLASCRFCDDIAVFDGGRLIQRGIHDALVMQDGKYRELWRAQAQYYEKPEQSVNKQDNDCKNGAEQV